MEDNVELQTEPMCVEIEREIGEHTAFLRRLASMEREHARYKYALEQIRDRNGLDGLSSESKIAFFALRDEWNS